MKCPNCGLNYTGDRCIYCNVQDYVYKGLEHTAVWIWIDEYKELDRDKWATFTWKPGESHLKPTKPKEDTMDQTPTCYHCGNTTEDPYFDDYPGLTSFCSACAEEMLQYLSQACKVAKLKADNWNKETK